MKKSNGSLRRSRTSLKERGWRNEDRGWRIEDRTVPAILDLLSSILDFSAGGRMKKTIAVLTACLLIGAYCLAQAPEQPPKAKGPKTKGEDGKKMESKKIEKVVKTDEEWEKILTPLQFHVMRKKGTERAFTGDLWNNHEKGVYVCAGCAQELFSSKTKFDSGTGWPSFWQPVAKENVETETDNSLGM